MLNPPDCDQTQARKHANPISMLPINEPNARESRRHPSYPGAPVVQSRSPHRDPTLSRTVVSSGGQLRDGGVQLHQRAEQRRAEEGVRRGGARADSACRRLPGADAAPRGRGRRHAGGPV
eukprot:7670995-Pyramimonas_sp.AAC.2